MGEITSFLPLYVWWCGGKRVFLRPMKGRRYIAYLLMAVSMLMLMASVLPHHHHREILCLQHDVTVCDYPYGTHSAEEGASAPEHRCPSGCVTQFHGIQPDPLQETVSPDISFCSLLYAVSDVWLHLWQHAEPPTPPLPPYVERLHAIGLSLTQGLRAPPVA